jgi:RimK family alpha-L-glutamate ligase
MRAIGILTRNFDSWCSLRLRKAIAARGYTAVHLSFRDLVARVGAGVRVGAREVDVVKNVDAVIVRPLGRGSLDECLFRVDLLHRLERLGVVVVNRPSAIEVCIDKYHAVSLLEENGIPVPKTVVTESVEEALKAFHELGGDVVVKPLFGSRGIGVARITDADVAERVFRTLRFLRHVLYVQEFFPHGERDIRAFVVGGKVIAAMYREADSWKTNIAKGARPRPLKLSSELEELAVRAAEVLGCEVAGVDILEGPSGAVVTEVNSQPSWRGLQSVTKVDIADSIVAYVVEKLAK